MLRTITTNPWQVDHSDSDDEIDYRLLRHASIVQKPPTPNLMRRQHVPKIADWDPIVIKEKRSFSRRKTAPSNEYAPSEQKPIFYGTRNLKSSNSVLERTTYGKAVVANTPVTPPASPPVFGSDFDPILLVQEHLSSFIYAYIPQDYPSFIHCRLRRDKTGIQKGFFPTFYLHFERPTDGKKIFLLAARKVVKVNGQNEYLITTNVETLSDKAGGDGCVGKLRGSNVIGTDYTLYDNGKSPKKFCNKHSHNRHGLRRELAGIVYNTNTLGTKGSRQMCVVMPKLDHDIQPTRDEDTILDHWREQRFDHLLQLHSRSPKYNEQTNTYMLQFYGNRVVRPSVKNFQIISETHRHHQEVVMQFGRVDEDTFVCDYRYPLSAIQAFGIALSSFDRRLARD